MTVRYIFMIEEFDASLGESGGHVWRKHADLVFNDEDPVEMNGRIAAIEVGLKEAEKVYAVGKVKGQ